MARLGRGSFARVCLVTVDGWVHPGDAGSVDEDDAMLVEGREAASHAEAFVSMAKAATQISKIRLATGVW
jgi:hypothetical protein